MYEYKQLFIDGQWVDPIEDGGLIDLISPSTEQPIGRVPSTGGGDIDAAVAAARRAFDDGPWPRMPSPERADLLERVCANLSARINDIARMVSEEIGTPITVSNMMQASLPVMVLNYYAELARTHREEQFRTGPFGSSVVLQEPVGVVGAITAWNYPLGLIAMKVGPALAAGCTVVLKPPLDAPLTAFVLAEAVAEAGLPAGVINVVPAGREVGERLVTHPGVDKISFTGSTAAGRRIMSLCGQQIKRVTLELGGKSPCILLEDAPLEAAIPVFANAALLNSGQTCTAQTRLLVHTSQHDNAVEQLCAWVASLKIGDPLDPETVLGPLASARQRDRVEDYIASGRESAATLVLGGGRPPELERGYYVEPTIFDHVDNQTRVAQEEIFGPVISVIPYENTGQAIDIANDTVYGLSGAVWTADVEKGMEVARKIRAGTFHVNGLGMDTTSPFGGYKQSGIGRELGPEGMLPYLEWKTVSVPTDFEDGQSERTHADVN